MSFKTSLLSLLVLVNAPLYSAEITDPVLACCCLSIHKGSIPIKLRTQDEWMLKEHFANGPKTLGGIFANLDERDPISGKKFGALIEEYRKRSEQFTVALVSEVKTGQSFATIQICDADALYEVLVTASESLVTSRRPRKFIEFGLKDSGVFEYVGTERFDELLRRQR